MPPVILPQGDSDFAPLIEVVNALKSCLADQLPLRLEQMKANPWGGQRLAARTTFPTRPGRQGRRGPSPANRQPPDPREALRAVRGLSARSAEVPPARRSTAASPSSTPLSTSGQVSLRAVSTV
jgi:hypothetical protein